MAELRSRTDAHRPSAIVPTDYDYVGQEVVAIHGIGDCQFILAMRERIQAHMAQTGGTYSAHDHSGNCGVCGNVNAIYTVLFWHRPSNTYVRMGSDCADKCDMGGDFGATSAFRKQYEDARLAVAGKRKAQALLSDAGLSAAWGLYVADVQDLYNSLGVQSLPYEEVTIRDMVSKLVRYGSISDNALGYLRILLGKIPERAQRNAEREAQRTAERASAEDAPTGRVKVTGVVLSTKWQESDYGITEKMLVKDDRGFKVWSTVPMAMSTPDKGERVQFTATLQPSKDDPKFAFAKRPVVPKPAQEQATGAGRS